MKTSETPNKQLIRELRALNEQLAYLNSWKTKFLTGVITGFATVVGATLVVALVIFILTQLATIQWLKPFVEEVVNIVSHSQRTLSLFW